MRAGPNLPWPESRLAVEVGDRSTQTGIMSAAHSIPR